MTLLLACIENADETAQVMAAGFDGVLGSKRHPAPVPNRPITIACMEPIAAPDAPVSRLLRIETTGESPRVLEVWTDACPAAPDLERLAAAGRHGVFLTSPTRLLDIVRWPEVVALGEACDGRGMPIGLAGGLELPDVPRLLILRPAFLAVGRVLRDRSGVLDAAVLRLLRGLVPENRASASDTGAIRMRPGCPDRIFIRDLVLEIMIGAYASERKKPQRVRFAVEAELLALDRPTRDMRDVVSYDLIADAIHALTAGRHVDFVETLAEEIADRVLRHPRIAAVRVAVEKLDLGPGAVGVEIMRQTRSSA